MPCHASIDGSEARMTPSGISGGRIGRNVAWRRGRRPGKADGDPVTNTFCVWEGGGVIGLFFKRGTEGVKG